MPPQSSVVRNQALEAWAHHQYLGMAVACFPSPCLQCWMHAMPSTVESSCKVGSGTTLSPRKRRRLYNHPFPLE